MEVHHHAHTGGKSFRHYLFEFFMLFLAVFCGFLAEYFLEHTIEHQREEQFVASLVKDLKDDTARINKVAVYCSRQLEGLDSLLNLLDTHPTHPDSVNKAYQLYKIYALAYERVVFNTRTLTQLKNSGSMRLIRNQSVSDSIMHYDAYMQNVELQFGLVQDSWRDESDYSFQLFDLGAVLRRRADPTRAQIFLTTDPKIFSGYTSRLTMFLGLIAAYNREIRGLKVLAEGLILNLEEHYDLD